MRTDKVVLKLIDQLFARRHSYFLAKGYERAQIDAVEKAQYDELENYSKMLMGLYVVLATVLMVVGLLARQLSASVEIFAVSTVAILGGALLTLAFNHATVRVCVSRKTGADELRYGYGPGASAVFFLCASIGYFAALS